MGFCLFAYSFIRLFPLLLFNGASSSVLPIPIHEFHLSKTVISYDQSANVLEVKVHLFIDDFEAALGNRGNDQLFLCTDKENSLANDYIFSYLQDHFKLKVNNQNTPLSFAGKEQSKDKIAVWCTLKSKSIHNIKEIAVHNDLLVELFDDQQNIVQIKMPGGKQGFFMFDKETVSDYAVF